MLTIFIPVFAMLVFTAVAVPINTNIPYAIFEMQ